MANMFPETGDPDGSSTPPSAHPHPTPPVPAAAQRPTALPPTALPPTAIPPATMSGPPTAPIADATAPTAVPPTVAAAPQAKPKRGNGELIRNIMVGAAALIAAFMFGQAVQPDPPQPFIETATPAAESTAIVEESPAGTETAIISAPLNAAEVGNVIISGAPLPSVSGPQLVDGTLAPSVAGVSPTGERTSISSDGVGRVIGFFAHWCAICQVEVPAASEWLTSNTLPAGVEVVAVSTAADETGDNWPPSDFLAEWPGPIILDNNSMSLAAAFGVTSLPSWVAVDSNGEVLYRTAGGIETDELSDLVAAVAPGADGPPEFVVRAANALHTAPVAIEGEALPTLTLPDSALGTPAPAVSGVNFDGEDVSISDDGVGRVIGFFAHWCPHCQVEVPQITNWLNASILPDDVEIVAVSTGVSADADNYPPATWFEREGWPAPVILDDAQGSLSAAFGLDAYPYWVAVNAEGDVIYRTSGALPIEQLNELVELVQPGATGLPSFVPTGLHNIDAAEANDLVNNPPENLVILDVRTPAEFATGHIEGAINLDFYGPTFWDQINTLGPANSYFIYCDSGNRSGQTFSALAGAGWPELSNLEGGIQGWHDLSLPLVIPE